MPDLLIPDWSEYQQVDHVKASAWLRQRNGGGAAAIFRVCYGDGRVDAQIDFNLDHADAYDAVGLYAYLPAGADPRSTAQVMARVIRAHGGLRRTWFVIVDDEEGDGDQSPRVDACLAELDVQLRTPNPAGQDWWYSGLNFAITHDLPAARGHRIIAAYQATEPTAVPHDMWQRTNAQVIDGVSGPCDCSVFHGSIADLLRLIGAGPSPSLPGGSSAMTIAIAPRPDGSGLDVFSVAADGSVQWEGDIPDWVEGTETILPGTGPGGIVARGLAAAWESPSRLVVVVVDAGGVRHQNVITTDTWKPGAWQQLAGTWLVPAALSDVASQPAPDMSQFVTHEQLKALLQQASSGA